MSEILPPLAALRVFESAARHLNFTRAADELGMTQAAVSYQIKILEERIGAPLFLRQPRQLVLTDAGRRLAPGVTEAFELMRASVAATRDRAETTLSITTLVSFAADWLVHRLGAFQLRHPDIAVRLDTRNEAVDFGRTPFDVGIRAGRGKWPGLDAHLVIRVDFTPMLAPVLAGKVKTPADLLGLKLLDPNDPWWAIWFAAAGVDFTCLSSSPELKLDSQALIGDAAVAGQGAAILTPVLQADKLARGALVQPFPLVCTEGLGFYLVYPHARRNAPHIRAFRDWILAEALPFAEPA